MYYLRAVLGFAVRRSLLLLLPLLSVSAAYVADEKKPHVEKSPPLDANIPPSGRTEEDPNVAAASSLQRSKKLRRAKIAEKSEKNDTIRRAPSLASNKRDEISTEVDVSEKADLFLEQHEKLLQKNLPLKQTSPTKLAEVVSSASSAGEASRTASTTSNSPSVSSAALQKAAREVVMAAGAPPKQVSETDSQPAAAQHGGSAGTAGVSISFVILCVTMVCCVCGCIGAFIYQEHSAMMAEQREREEAAELERELQFSGVASNPFHNAVQGKMSIFSGVGGGTTAAPFAKKSFGAKPSTGSGAANLKLDMASFRG
ncbi:unnamed protein product [Amoebophrya sp. A120]|nr:unnamed protein product [Amoebophrya sp. A120]|eukprot:GSA120T00014900001.1